MFVYIATTIGTGDDADRSSSCGEGEKEGVRTFWIGVLFVGFLLKTRYTGGRGECFSCSYGALAICCRVLVLGFSSQRRMA